MSAVRWYGIAQSDALSETLIHFFPAPALGVAPYPVQCTLTALRSDGAPLAVVIDGARLHQPDGVRFGEAFPELRQTNVGFCGFCLEISPAQSNARGDVQGSSLSIEIGQTERAVFYRPFRDDEIVPGRGRAPVVRDALSIPSIAFVNLSERDTEARWAIEPSTTVYRGNSNHSTVVRGFGVVESPIGDAVLEQSAVYECSWGLVRLGSLDLQPVDSSLRAFMVYREPSSKRLLSVLPL